MKVTKAIIAVAGYGTRRLPITKSIEKCMLPLLNRPLIDYVVQDCIAAGVTDIYFVVSGGAAQLRSYYERNVALESYLQARGKTEMISGITPPANVTFHYIEQDQQDARYGTSVPVWLCRDYIAPDELVFIIMGDQHLYRDDGGSEIAHFAEYLERVGSKIGLVGVAVPPQKDQFYGLLQLDAESRLISIVENPSSDDNPTKYKKNASIYLVYGDFMPLVDRQMHGQPNAKGEYYIIDVVNQYLEQNPMPVYSSSARYFDCGTLESWVSANTELLGLTRS